ncbi:hypothetical protein M153_18500010025 [Pseudoloma neurophilia]|uniref:Uncharacterized protein n=1 Tax=Pseudoloma neurophilia TaxID=146866 RepID=A0A0R0M541_9MICR|nr:hypothetical protein M153_18500010025 [Pseudoloma neurophilia]
MSKNKIIFNNFYFFNPVKSFRKKITENTVAFLKQKINNLF